MSITSIKRLVRNTISSIPIVKSVEEPVKYRNTNEDDFGERYGEHWFGSDDIADNSPAYLLTKSSATCVARHEGGSSQIWLLPREQLSRLVMVEPRGTNWWTKYSFTVAEGDIAIVTLAQSTLLPLIAEAVGGRVYTLDTRFPDASQALDDRGGKA